MLFSLQKTIIFFLLFAAVLSGTSQSISKGSIQYLQANVYGGKVELKRFVQQEMNYPKKALAQKQEGVVEVAALVDVKGNYTDLHIKESVSPLLDKEAIRLFKMLLFNPTPYLGGATKRYSTVKFKFSVKLYKKYCKKRAYNTVEIDTTINNYVYTNNQLKVKPKILFEDSLENISSFIYGNLNYPEGTLRLSITGLVKLFFVIEPSGRITNIKVLDDVGGGATNETLRLLKLLKWKAGELKGKKVRCSKTFEVNFNLTNDAGMDYVPTSY
ncbi:MAG: TonB family protein [Vicingaceae bacterium]